MLLWLQIHAFYDLELKTAFVIWSCLSFMYAISWGRRTLGQHSHHWIYKWWCRTASRPESWSRGSRTAHPTPMGLRGINLKIWLWISDFHRVFVVLVLLTWDLQAPIFQLWGFIKRLLLLNLCTRLLKLAFSRSLLLKRRHWAIWSCEGNPFQDHLPHTRWQVCRSRCCHCQSRLEWDEDRKTNKCLMHLVTVSENGD